MLINSFIVDVPAGEVKLWPLHSLRVADQQEIKTISNFVDINVVRAKRLEARNISEDEQFIAIKAPARTKRASKAPTKFTPASW